MIVSHKSWGNTRRQLEISVMNVLGAGNGRHAMKAEWGVVLVLALAQAAMRLNSVCLAQGSGRHAVEFRKSSGQGARVTLLKLCNPGGR